MPLFAKGFRVGTSPDQDRWLIVKKLGEGQFAEVYEVKDTMDGEKRYALKIERRRDVRSVKQEFKVLKKIQERAPSLVCTVHACGTFEDRFFMIMELLGNNVAEARKAAGGRFDLATARRLATSMLRGLEEVHAAGFVHRDVKPANFAVGPPFADPLTGMWKVIDFGLARRYLGDAGDVLPERTDTSFRGSTTYASVHAHAEQDLGRRDDLWSWLYCTIELLEGTLPWRTDLNRDPDSREAVLRMKQACIAEPSRYLRPTSSTGAAAAGAAGGPHHLLLQPSLLGPVQQLSNYIASLGFADAPDYGLMYGCLAQLPDDVGGLMAGPGPGSLAAAVGMWGMGVPGAAEVQYGQAAAAAAAVAAAQMMYHQQYFGHHHHHHHHNPPLVGMPPGAAYWSMRGAWADPAMYAQQHPQQAQQQLQHPNPHSHHQQHSQHQQQQQTQGYLPGGPPPPPDPGRSSPLDTPASPPPEFGGSGSGGGGVAGGIAGHESQPPLQPPPPLQTGQAAPAAAGGASPLADVPAELVEAMLTEALAERAGPDQSREAAQVAEVQEYVDLVKQGHVSGEAHDVAGRLMVLEPVEALATISYVLDAIATYAVPATANTAAVALSALGAYARDASKRAMVKYCRALAAQLQPQTLAFQHQNQQQQQIQQQQQPQNQQQQQQRGPGRVVGGGVGGS